MVFISNCLRQRGQQNELPIRFSVSHWSVFVTRSPFLFQCAFSQSHRFIQFKLSIEKLEKNKNIKFCEWTNEVCETTKRNKKNKKCSSQTESTIQWAAVCWATRQSTSRRTTSSPMWYRDRPTNPVRGWSTQVVVCWETRLISIEVSIEVWLVMVWLKRRLHNRIQLHHSSLFINIQRFLWRSNFVNYARWM